MWVAVSHGDPIKAVLADAMGAGLAGLQRVHVDPASVSVVRWSGGRPMVMAVNSSGGAIRTHQGAAKDVPAGDNIIGGGTG